MGIEDHMDQRELLARIPFEVSSVRVIDGGWANAVIEADGEWIFRFSRTALTASQMRLEAAFLLAFANESPVHVPRIAFHEPEFMGYRKLIGAPLTRDLRERLTKEQQSQVGRDLGSFLTSLHSARFAHPDIKEFPYGGEHFWDQLWSPVAHHLTERARKNARDYFEAFFRLIEDTPPELTLTHCDLGTSNILYDPSTNQLSVIDFGDLCLHDPARDFNGLVRNHGLEFTKTVASEYRGDRGEYFWERVDFYAKRQPFMLYWCSPLFEHCEYQAECLEQIESLFSA